MLQFDGIFKNLRFQDPWIFLLIPLVFIPFFVSKRNTARAPIACAKVMLPPGVKFPPSRMRHLGSALRSCSIFIILIALARPQLGHIPSSRTTEGVDIVLAIDTSGSMRARDFEVHGERPDRLEVVKRVIGEFISARPDDRFGMVVFGSEAYTQSPLTGDHDVLLNFLEHVEIGMAGDGTAIGDGLATAIKRLKGSPTKSRVIVMLTDGANNSGRIDPIAAANAAKSLGIRVHAIGVGSEGVAPIVQNGRVFHIKADIDEKTLKSIAEVTGGQYWRATDTSALISVYREIDKLEKVKRDNAAKHQGRDIFAMILLVALFSFFGELVWRTSNYRRVPA